MYYYKIIDETGVVTSVLSCDQLLEETEYQVRISEEEYEQSLAEIEFSEEPAPSVTPMQALLDELNELRGRLDSSEYLIEEQLTKSVEISREDFDLLDVKSTDTTYTIIEEDGSITVRKGED